MSPRPAAPSGTSAGRSARGRLLGVCGAAVLSLAACGGGAGAGAAGSSFEPAPPPTTASVAPVGTPAGQVAAPLTGLPTDPARAALPAVAAAVLLASGGAPPRGLDAADLVFVDYVEPGAVRLVSLFQSQDAPAVGPLGWARPEDAKALSVFGPVLAHDGGPKGFLAQLPRLDVAAVSNADSPSLFTAVPGSNEYVSTAVVRAAATKGLTAPPAAFTTSATAPLARQGLGPATALTVTVPGQPTMSWVYDQAGRVWRATLAGTPVSAANLVVLAMTYTTVTLHSPKRYLPSPAVTGTGAVQVLSRGTTATGTWTKATDHQLIGLADRSGYPFSLAPGTSWVLLMPPTGKAVVG